MSRTLELRRFHKHEERYEGKYKHKDGAEMGR